VGLGSSGGIVNALPLRPGASQSDRELAARRRRGTCRSSPCATSGSPYPCQPPPEQRRELPTHAARVGAGEVCARDQRIGCRQPPSWRAGWGGPACRRSVGLDSFAARPSRACTSRHAPRKPTPPAACGSTLSFCVQCRPLHIAAPDVRHVAVGESRHLIPGASVGQPTEPCLAKLIQHAAIGRMLPIGQALVAPDIISKGTALRAGALQGK
jgi:hypothetical protein